MPKEISTIPDGRRPGRILTRDTKRLKINELSWYPVHHISYTILLSGE